MEFSTEVVEKMAEILVKEMEKSGEIEGGMREIETGMRELLRRVGGEALVRYMEKTNQAEPHEKRKACVNVAVSRSTNFGAKR